MAMKHQVQNLVEVCVGDAQHSSGAYLHLESRSILLLHPLHFHFMLMLSSKPDGAEPGVHIRVSASENTPLIPPGGAFKQRWEYLPNGHKIQHYRTSLEYGPMSPTKPYPATGDRPFGYPDPDNDVEDASSASTESTPLFSDWVSGLELKSDIDSGIDSDIKSDIDLDIESDIIATSFSDSVLQSGPAWGAQLRARLVRAMRSAKLRARARTRTRINTQIWPCSSDTECSNGDVCTYEKIEALMAKVRGTTDGLPMLGVCMASMGR
jgi:hypothetical protein